MVRLSATDNSLPSISCISEAREEEHFLSCLHLYLEGKPREPVSASLGLSEQDVDHDLYRLVSPHLVSAIHTAAAFVGKSDAEDAVQEAILCAWKAWPSLRQRDSV